MTDQRGREYKNAKWAFKSSPDSRKEKEREMGEQREGGRRRRETETDTDRERLRGRTAGNCFV